MRDDLTWVIGGRSWHVERPVDLIASGIGVAEGMAHLIAECTARFPQTDWEALNHVDFHEEVASLHGWLCRLLEEEPPPETVRGLWFALSEDLTDDGEELSILQLIGSDRFTSEGDDFEWRRARTYEPAAARISTDILNAIHASTRSVAGDVANVTGYALKLGYAGLLVAKLCDLIAGEVLVANRSALAIAVGFEDGDTFVIGSVTRTGFHRVSSHDASMPCGHFGLRESLNADQLLDMALGEDLGTIGDVTTAATIAEGTAGTVAFVTRGEGVVAGLPVIRALADRFGLFRQWSTTVRDGTTVPRGTEIARLTGPLPSLLALERTALNFLQRLSGIATLTARFVAAVEGTRAVILDTRKTTPGSRALEKYAVRCGGGQNHRFGLFDAVLIKDNHLAGLGDSADPIGSAIAHSRTLAPPGTVVEIEVDSLAQLDRALECGPDIILLDNFSPISLVEAVRRRDTKAPGILLEASGGITLETVRGIAETGVDRISVGALTHSAQALDIGLDYLEG